MSLYVKLSGMSQGKKHLSGAEITPAPVIEHVRAHHAFRGEMIDPVFQAAITGAWSEKRLYDEAALGLSMSAYYQPDHNYLPPNAEGRRASYNDDTFGPGLRGLQRLINRTGDRYVRLSKLRDVDFLSIGAAMDDTCKGTEGQDHCMQRFSAAGFDVITGERRYAQAFLKFIAGYIPVAEGSGYRWITETIPMIEAGQLSDKEVLQLHIQAGTVRAAFALADLINDVISGGRS